jgi:hypothetical protein
MKGFWPSMIGKEAFTKITEKGYFEGKLLKKDVRKHRVIWKWMTGEDPEIVDHKDGNPQNNRWKNLTNVDIVRSNRNRSTPKNNTSGYTGIRIRPSGMFYAFISIGGKAKGLGTHATFDEAYNARRNAEFKYGYNLNHGREKVVPHNL